MNAAGSALIGDTNIFVVTKGNDSVQCIPASLLPVDQKGRSVDGILPAIPIQILVYALAFNQQTTRAYS